MGYTLSDMRLVPLIPWLTAISLAAFTFGSALSVLHYTVSGTYYGLNMLDGFRYRAFPVALAACLSIGLPLALAFRAPHKIAVGSIVISGLLWLTLLVWAAYGQPLLSIGFGAVVFIVFVICFSVTAVPTFAFVLWASGEVRSITTRPPSAAPRPTAWRSVLLAALALAPSSAYAITATSHDYDCRDVHLAPSSPLKNKGGVTIDIDKSDWPRVKQVLDDFGTARGLRSQGPDPWRQHPGSPAQLVHLCSTGQLVIGATGWLWSPPHVGLGFYAPDDDMTWKANARDLLTVIVSRWPDAKVTSYADLDPPFERSPPKK